MPQDNKLRNYLIATIVTAVSSAGGCAVKSLYARVDKVEDEVTQQRVNNAIIRQDVEDFRRSFEEFKGDVKNDIDRHHR